METCVKRVFLYFCISLLVGLFGKTWAQSQVSTEKTPKNVLLEEFTGVGCGNCPDGQRYIKKLMQAHPDRIFALSVHQGYYAEPVSDKVPDYRTEFGDSLYIQGGDYGYPCANINRRLFPGQSILNLGRSQWVKNSKNLSKEEAIVNIWASATLDYQTRELIVNVEAYYTANSSEDYNLLNIALAQNRIIGYQNGGGENYQHNHVLRHLITGQWGDTIKDPKKDKLFTKEYRYSIPADYRKVEAVLEDMELLIYISKTKKDIENVMAIRPKILNFEETPNVELLIKDLPTRYGYNFFPLSVRNTGNDTIKQIEFLLKLNEKEENILWEQGVIPPYHTSDITIEIDEYERLNRNTLSITAKKVNARAVDNTAVNAEFNAPILSTENIIFFAKTDSCPDENIWQIKDADGNLVKKWGPFPQGVQTEFSDSLTLEKDKTYCFEILDLWGDGLFTPPGAYLKMYSKSKEGKQSLLAQTYEIKEFGDYYFFTTSKVLSKEKEVQKAAKLYLSPNPCRDYSKLNIEVYKKESLLIKIFDIRAHLKDSFSLSINQEGMNEYTLDTKNLSDGLYFISVQFADGRTEILKLIKN